MTEPLWVDVRRDKIEEAFDWVADRGGWNIRTMEQIQEMRAEMRRRLDGVPVDHITRINIGNSQLVENDKLLFKLIFGGAG